MRDKLTLTQAETLLGVLKSELSKDGARAFLGILIYTSFGVVRGRTGASHLQSDGESGPQMIEVLEATVEHYSSHLPTASFDKLYIRLDDIIGFALIPFQG